jgi:hypothetical protein
MSVCLAETFLNSAFNYHSGSLDQHSYFGYIQQAGAGAKRRRPLVSDHIDLNMTSGKNSAVYRVA